MTTPHPSVTPRAGALIPFIILSDSNDEVTTLPVRPTPPSPDYVPASPNYLPDSNLDSNPSEDNSPGDDLTKTAKSLHTQAASTSIVHLKPSLLPSSSSPPPSLLPSSSSPSPLPLLSSSRKRPRSPSPSPSVPPLPERVKSVGDDVETLRARLASAEQGTVTLRTRVGSLEQHDVVTRDSLRIFRGRITRLQLRAMFVKQEVLELLDFWVIDRLEILDLCSRAEYTKTRLEKIHNRLTGDSVRTKRVVMTKQEVEALRARAEAAEQRAKAL
ncbi:hypothetical protein Tco_0484342 [Tanacetum coccineum]